MSTVTITIEMTDKDFGMLSVDHSPLQDVVHAQNFEPYEDPTAAPALHFEHAYWLEPGWTTVMLAKAFLTAQGAAFELVYDHGMDGCNWVLLTNYRNED